jgi:predicted GH43/DUF377 family glycosyl hydrolase
MRVVLHDLQNPARILGVRDSWILQPEDPLGDYRICAQCGLYLWRGPRVRWDSVDLLGGADPVMCVGEANLTDLVALCLQHSRSA